MSIPNVIADFSTILALKVAVGATTATLVSATDDDGVALPTGTYGFTIDRKNSKKEYITATLTGTALTNVKTIAVGTGIATTGFAKTHRRSAEVVITDFVVIKRLQDVFETGYDFVYTPVSDYMLATKKYVDDVAFGGSVTLNKLVIVGNAGEAVAAGNLVYKKVSDGEWYLCDADTASTLNNVLLGIAQGAGTDGNAITGGILIKGLDTNQTGLTINSIYYASNTAGGVSLTSGTNPRVIGVSTSTTDILFDPDFNKVNTVYAVDSVGTDAYAVTVQSALGALYAGMRVTFQAGTANTGAATLAVNGLTAKAITKYGTTALATGDILANQVIEVVYDGTQFQMVSSGIPTSIPLSSLPIPSFAQDFSTSAVNTTSTGEDLAIGSNSDGSVLYIYFNSSTDALYRFQRDAITGQYFQTHKIDPTIAVPSADFGSIIVIGSYIYFFSNDGTNVKCSRFSADDLTGEQAMTVPVVPCTTQIIVWTNGTDAYLVSDQSPTTSRKWTLSGTTFSASTTATVADLYHTMTSSIWDGTNAYVAHYDISDGFVSIYKLTNIDGSTKTTTTKTLGTGVSDVVNGYIIMNIDSTRMYLGFTYPNRNESGADTIIGTMIRLYPTSKP